MAVVVKWDEENAEILHFETSGRWIPEEFHEGLYKIRHMIAQANPMPEGILFIPNGMAPTGLFQLLRIGLRFGADMNLPCVVIAPPEFSGRFYEVLQRYYPADILYFAPNIEAARDLLKRPGRS